MGMPQYVETRCRADACALAGGGDLLNAEISEKQARSIKHQLTTAKLPLAKDLGDFKFEGTPINETLVNELASSVFIATSVMPCWGGTGTGKTHLACHRQKLHPLRRPRPVLQRGRSRQPARDRGSQRAAGSARRSSDDDRVSSDLREVGSHRC